jgi:hypothetical protein
MAGRTRMTGHVIHLGYPKTGSNWLRRWFAGHPQLGYAEGGVAGFNDVYEIARQSAAAPDSVLCRVTSCEGFAAPTMSFGLAAMDYEGIERTSMRAAQAGVCRTLAGLFPNARVLVVTRGYQSMLHSSYAQMALTGADLDFESFCRLVEEAAGRGDNPWDYDCLLAEYREAFTKARVIAAPYELLRDDPEAFTRTLEARLGLAHSPGPAAPVNPSPSPEELYWRLRLTRMVRALPIGFSGRRFLWGRYLRGIGTNRFRWILRVLQRLGPVALAPPVVPERTLTTFRGRADSLRSDPVYAGYAAEYLWD